MGQNTSEVSIANQALGWLGLDPIISLDDPSKAAALCKVNFAPLRDVILEATDWTFAQSRKQLAPTTLVPEWGYSYKFLLPADCLRVAYVTANPDLYEAQPLDQWVREASYVLCNAEAVYIRYTRREVDPKVWSEGFSQALAARLASDIAIPATNSKEHMQMMFELFQKKLSDAVANDGRQGRKQKMQSNDLKRARR